MKKLTVTTLALAAWCGTAAAQQAPLEYSGICDASAAVAVGQDMFIVASDEDNVLRLYRRGEPNVKQSFPLDSLLKPDPENPEADLEGAARIGEDVYWIGSHGQNKNGKDRPSRLRLFATRVTVQDGKVALRPVGMPYTSLRDDLIAAPQLAKYDLSAAANSAPEAPGGFNIEGLAATPDDRLLVGFRNPITRGMALLVPIENPKEIVEGKMAKIGMPIELPLEGRGIRSIEFSQERNGYVLIAGPHDDTGTFALYTWSGQPGEQPEMLTNVNLGSLSPEAVLFEPGDKASVQVFSDDGGRKMGQSDCKDVDPQAQRFRGMSLTIQ
jgi:Protein of unknown function (DUF3616)